MKVGHISSDGESRENVSRGGVAHIRGDGADDLDAFGFCRVDHGAAAHTIDGDTVDEVRVTPLLAGADGS